MTRFAKGRWMALALPLLLSCAENDQRLRVTNIALPPKGIGSECSASAGTTNLARGILDLAAADAFKDLVQVDYRVFPTVEVGFMAPGTGDLSTLTPSPGVPPHTLVITDVVADLNVGLQSSVAGPLKTVAGLTGADLKFRTPIFARVDGNGTVIVPGVAVPETAVRKLAAVRDQLFGSKTGIIVISSRIRVLGIKDGNSDVESSYVDFPIELCNGCLFSVISACANVTDADTTFTGAACSPIQDYPLRCCTQDSKLVCPAARPAMAGN